MTTATTTFSPERELRQQVKAIVDEANWQNPTWLETILRSEVPSGECQPLLPDISGRDSGDATHIVKALEKEGFQVLQNPRGDKEDSYPIHDKVAYLIYKKGAPLAIRLDFPSFTWQTLDETPRLVVIDKFQVYATSIWQWIKLVTGLAAGFAILAIVATIVYNLPEMLKLVGKIIWGVAVVTHGL